MIMRRRRDDHTPDLFAAVPRPAPMEPATMDYRPVVAHLLGRMIQASALDRYEIAARVSRLVGREVSKCMLDGYTAESREAFNLPAYLVPPVEAVCESTLLSGWIAEVRGGRLMLGAAALDAEIGRLETELTERRDELREMRELRRRVR